MLFKLWWPGLVFVGLWFMWVNPWLPLVLLVTLLAQIVWRFYNFIKFHRDTVATFQVEVLIFSEPQWKRVVLLKQVVIESEGGFKDNYHDLPDHSDSRCCEYHEPVLHQSPEDSNEKDSVLNLSHLSGILHDAVLSLVFVREETTGAHVLQHHSQVQPNDGKHASFISLLYIKDSICFVGLSICLFP